MLKKILQNNRFGIPLLVARVRARLERRKIASGLVNPKWVNLCCGNDRVPGFYNTDIRADVDLYLDLEKDLLPFKNESLQYVVCISAINYFTRKRAEEIIEDVYRTLKPGGVVRFAVQDLRGIAQKYINNDREFFYQQRADGRDRFPGETMADKINAWFYGYLTHKGTGGKYMYDFETLSLLFKRAGFTTIEGKAYRDSRIPHIEQIDNRQDQMFFLEAIK